MWLAWTRRAIRERGGKGAGAIEEGFGCTAEGSLLTLGREWLDWCLWEITSCGRIRGSAVGLVTDREPLSNPGEALESLAGGSAVEVEKQAMSLSASDGSGSSPEMGSSVD